MTPLQQQSKDPDVGLHRRVIGFFLFPVALFPLLALLTYDWHRIPNLCIPVDVATSNLIGPLGDWFAYRGYQSIGLMVWSIPIILIFTGIHLLSDKPLNFGRKFVYAFFFLFTSACFLQLCGRSVVIAGMMHSLNIEPNAGGAIGYFMMTCFLAKFLSPFGAGIIMVTLSILFLLLMIGVRRIIRAIAGLFNWALGHTHTNPVESEEERAAREQVIKQAREAAKAQLEANRAAINAEKEDLKAKREAAKAAKEKARLQELAEKEAAKARLDAMNANAGIGSPSADVSPYIPTEEASVDPVKQFDLFGNEDPDAWLINRKRNVTKAPSHVKTSAPKPPPPASAAQNVAKAAEPTEKTAPVNDTPYVIPPIDILSPVPQSTAQHGDVAEMSQRLIDTLKVFDINATVAYTVKGPVVTQYAIQPERGVKVERISGLSRNIQMLLKAKSLRIQAPIPGENAVGIEVPNTVAATVSFREILESKLWQEKAVWSEGRQPKFYLPLLLGKDAAGHDLVADLTKIPHLLVAGATGQGKSVCLNSIINGLLMCRTPDQLRFIMVDPKRVEFTSYNRLPHLLVPVVNDTKKVVFALRWAAVEMDKRLKMFSRAACRNIVDFNTRKITVQPDMFDGKDEPTASDGFPRTIPYIVIIIDELADIMQQAVKDVEPVLARLLALARATGIHLILATQRPDTKVITGTLKSNIPGRIAFKTSQGNDSRTILDSIGAEDLIGKGDMLFKTAEGLLLRAQGSFIPDKDINAILDFIGEHAAPHFDEKFLSKMDKIKEDNPSDALEDPEDNPPPEQPAPTMAASVGGIPAPKGMTQEKDNQLYMAALDVVRRTGKASTSHLQRRMGIGYNHAARLMDLLEDRGIIGPPKAGAGPRDILVDLDAMLGSSDADSAAIPVNNDAVPGESSEGPADDITPDGFDEISASPISTDEEQV